MKSIKYSTENLIALLLFLLALGYRLIDLARVPLSDVEAGLALPALALAQGQGASSLSQPGYISLTGLFFFLFGSSDFLARLIPALSGSLLVLAPLLFRKQLGMKASLVLALLFAVDPGLMAFSRTAGGTMLTLGSSLLALGLLFNRRFILAGVCGGLALLGGEQLWPGLITGGLAFWMGGEVLREIFKAHHSPEMPTGGEPTSKKFFSGERGQFWLTLAITAGMIATQFFIHPQGLNGIANSLVDYVRGWTMGFSLPSIQSGLLFLVYEPAFLALALFRGVKAWFTGDAFDKFLFRWMLLAALLSFVNPGQAFATSAWVLIPMLVLAARLIGEIIPARLEWKAPAGAQAILTFALVIFALMNLVSLSWGTSTPDDMRLKIIAVAGSIAILGLASYLLGTSWGWEATAPGFIVAAGVLALLAVIAASWHAAGLGRQPEREMWRNGRTVIAGDLLKTTVGDISEFNTGRRDRIDVRIIDLESPALDWTLRGFPKTSHVQGVVGDENSAVLISSADRVPALGEKYRGQKIVWASRPAWDLLNPGEWPGWLFFRAAPLDDQALIVWVRTDLFPGAAPAENVNN